MRRGGYNFNELSDKNVQEMQHTIESLDNGAVSFKIDIQPNGYWIAESINIDGIMSGGPDASGIPAMLKDAIFTYFEIPPKLCNDSLLHATNEPSKVVRQVHVAA